MEHSDRSPESPDQPIGEQAWGGYEIPEHAITSSVGDEITAPQEVVGESAVDEEITAPPECSKVEEIDWDAALRDISAESVHELGQSQLQEMVASIEAYLKSNDAESYEEADGCVGLIRSIPQHLLAGQGLDYEQALVLSRESANEPTHVVGFMLGRIVSREILEPLDGEGGVVRVDVEGLEEKYAEFSVIEHEGKTIVLTESDARLTLSRGSEVTLDGEGNIVYTGGDSEDAPMLTRRETEAILRILQRDVSQGE